MFVEVLAVILLIHVNQVHLQREDLSVQSVLRPKAAVSSPMEVKTAELKPKDWREE